MALPEMVEQLWSGRTLSARVARFTLSPLAAAYGIVAEARGRLYDVGVLPSTGASIPVVSVGNLTVGGTGKTPIASWLVATLRERGLRPGVVLRDYGAGDEADVHRVLNPDAPVIVNADRVAGVRALAAQHCDVAVLDDAFQHRHARRAVDIVLVNADTWSRRRWLLPVGPWRERLSALRRAQVVLITRKTATADTVDAVRRAVQRVIAPRRTWVGRRQPAGRVIGMVSLLPDGLRTLAGGSNPLASLRGARVRAVAGIGDPLAFFAQLRAAGARVDGIAYRDHHHYTPEDVTEIRRRAPPGVTVVCTLKDAVKLGPLWPREAEPIWYVSQRVEFERGLEVVQAALDAACPVTPVPGRTSS